MPEPRLRLLLVVAETTGGIGRHVRVLAEALPALGFAVAVAGPPSALAGVGDRAAVARHEIPIGSAISARRALHALLRRVDVVHAHGLRAGAISAAARRGTAARLVVTWHNAPLVTGGRRVVHGLVSRYVARAADLTLGASPDLAAAARRYGATDARDSFVVAPPMPPPTRSRLELRRELHVGREPLVLAVGRLQAQKRFDVLIDAAARWVLDGSGPTVVIAGSGPDEAALRARAAVTNAPVRMIGARDDVPDLLSAADVVALPSEWEARSLVAQEALRAGVPLVTTPVGGLPELVGSAAVFVPVGDPDALREAIERLVADEGLRRQLAQDGRQQAATWPSVEDSVASLAATYRALRDKS